MSWKRWMVVTIASYVLGYATCGWMILGNGQTIGRSMARLGARLANAAMDPEILPETDGPSFVRTYTEEPEAQEPEPVRTAARRRSR